MNYFEIKTFTETNRKDYLESLINFSKGYINIDKTSNLAISGIGVPLCTSDTVVSKSLLSKEDTYSIYRCRFLINNTISCYGLLFEINSSNPLVVMQHGYLGTPEIMSCLYEDRNSSNYNDIVPRLLNLGANVFCPQLLMWSIPEYGVEYDREKLDILFREKGSSLIGVECLCLEEIIHYFKNQSYKHIDLFGMSYGGAYTYFTSLLTNEIYHYWVCSYGPVNIRFKEMHFNDSLMSIFSKAYNNNEMYITLGRQDPIMDWEKIKAFKEFLNNANRFFTFDGNHEVIKDDTFLKSII